VNAFLVHHSTISEHRAPPKGLFEITSSDEDACVNALLGRHIVEPGTKDIFGFRTYEADETAVDSAVFTKVTIVAPKIDIGTKVDLSDPGVRVAITSAAPGWVQRCFGYEDESARGSVTIRKDDHGVLSADLKIEAAMKPVVSGPQRPYSLRIDKTLPIQIYDVSQLTPWQGARTSDWTKLTHP
jgi:hypothetical protein